MLAGLVRDIVALLPAGKVEIDAEDDGQMCGGAGPSSSSSGGDEYCEVLRSFQVSPCGFKYWIPCGLIKRLRPKFPDVAWPLSR